MKKKLPGALVQMLYKRLYEYTQIQLQILYSLKLVIPAVAGWSGKKIHSSVINF